MSLWNTLGVLILVRHGRTALNAAGRLQGRVDEPLDEIGMQQALAVAARVGPVDELVSSPLGRASRPPRRSACRSTIDERWIELAYGVYEGVSSPRCRPRRGAMARGPDFVPDGGESLAGSTPGCRRATEIAERAATLVAVVVATSRRSSRPSWALGAGVEIAWRSHLSHASICRIDIRRTGPVPHTFNETAD